MTRSCPYCGKHHDAATRIEAQQRIKGTTTQPFEPSPGDVGLCISCGEWMVITEGGGARKPTDDEMIEIGTGDNYQRIRKAWVMAQMDGGKH